MRVAVYYNCSKGKGNTVTNFGNAKRPVGVVTVAPWNSQKGCDHRQKERKIIMRIERVEKIVLNDNDTKLLADFLDLVDDIDREVVDPDIRTIIKGIHQDINELENHLSYE